MSDEQPRPISLAGYSVLDRFVDVASVAARTSAEHDAQVPYGKAANLWRLPDGIYEVWIVRKPENGTLITEEPSGE